MSLTDYTQMRSTKKVIPSDELVHIAQKEGFSVRRTGGSHIVLSHETHKEFTTTIVAGTTKLAHQREFAKMLIKLKKIECASKASEPTQDQNSIRILKDVQSKLPHYISADLDERTNLIVLRDSNIPQLGITLKPGEERLLPNKIKYMDDLKRETYKLLNQAHTMFDLQSTFRKGVFTGTLTHTTYDLNLPPLRPYEAGDAPGDFMLEIMAARSMVSAKDAEHKERLESLLKKSFIKATMVAFSARRGDRKNVVCYEKDGNPQRLSFMFETASNRRADSHDVHGGRISERELARVETIIHGIERAQSKAPRYQMQAFV